MRILIADKQDLFRQSLISVLSEVVTSPLTVFEADCKVSFISNLHKEKISLILLSSNICYQGAPENCEYDQIRLYQPHTPVLLIEDVLLNSAPQGGPQYPVEGRINKSFAPASYQKAVRQLLNGGTYFPSQHQDQQRAAIPQSGHLSDLTPRQREVLGLLAQGRSNREIAKILNLSEGTVKVHVTAIFRAFNVRNRTQAMLLAQDVMG